MNPVSEAVAQVCRQRQKVRVIKVIARQRDPFSRSALPVRTAGRSDHSAS